MYRHLLSKPLVALLISMLLYAQVASAWHDVEHINTSHNASCAVFVGVDNGNIETTVCSLTVNIIHTLDLNSVFTSHASAPRITQRSRAPPAV